MNISEKSTQVSTWGRNHSSLLRKKKKSDSSLNFRFNSTHPPDFVKYFVSTTRNSFMKYKSELLKISAFVGFITTTGKAGKNPGNEHSRSFKASLYDVVTLSRNITVPFSFFPLRRFRALCEKSELNITAHNLRRNKMFRKRYFMSKIRFCCELVYLLKVGILDFCPAPPPPGRTCLSMQLSIFLCWEFESDWVYFAFFEEFAYFLSWDDKKLKSSIN